MRKIKTKPMAQFPLLSKNKTKLNTAFGALKSKKKFTSIAEETRAMEKAIDKQALGAVWR